MEPTTSEKPGFPFAFALLLAAVSGCLQFLSFPNFIFTSHSGWQSALAFVAWVPYLLIWRRSTWPQAMLLGWCTGLYYCLGLLTWLFAINPHTVVANAITWLLLSAYGAIYFGLFGATSRWLSQRLPLPAALILPLAWVAWEFVRGHVLAGGLPWGNLGHTQYANPILRQMAAVAGVAGISFIIMFSNVVLSALLAYLPAFWRHPRFASLAPLIILPKQPWVLLLSAGMAVLWLWLSAICALEAWKFSHLRPPEIKLALIQGNLNTRQNWNLAYRTAAMASMTRLHLEAAALKPDLIVWAESSFPGILEHPAYQELEFQLRTLIRRIAIPTLLTSNEYAPEKNPEKAAGWHHYNSAFLFGPLGQVLGRYRKIRLVPFGEYIPYACLQQRFNAVVRQPIPIDFEPGDDYTVFTLNTHNFSALICYEDLFEDLGRAFARSGATFLVSLGNNGWGSQSAMTYQHTAMSVFLAVENRVSLAKTDMTGPTCLIDPWGNIGKTLPAFTEAVTLASIRPAAFSTFYSRWGYALAACFTLVFFILLAGAWVPSIGRQPGA